MYHGGSTEMYPCSRLTSRKGQKYHILKSKMFMCVISCDIFHIYKKSQIQPPNHAILSLIYI